MKPTIARTVHYQSDGEQDVMAMHSTAPRAAIITDVHTNSVVDLCVLTAYGMFTKRGAPYSEQPKPGHWNWPPREPAPTPDKRAVGGILPCNDPAPGDVGVLHADGSHEYVRPTSPIPDDAADRLRYLARAPRKRTN